MDSKDFDLSEKVLEDSVDNVSKKVIKAAVASLVLAIIFYVLSFTKICTIELEISNFSSCFILFMIMIFMASFWIFTYWNMDKIKKEPCKSILHTFCSALFIHFFMLSIFDRIFASAVQPELPHFWLLKFVLLPILSIYIVFDLYVFRLASFDEFIDSMIYGGFTGIGIGCAIFLNEVLAFESLNVRYLIQILIVRLLICSSVCALSGFLVYKLRNVKKLFYMIVSIVVMLVIFLLDFFLDSVIDKNIRLAQFDILRFAVPFVLTIIVYIITAVFIAKNISKEHELAQKNPVFYKIYGIVLIAAIITYCFVFQCQLNKTVRFFSNDGCWSFELPADFSEIKNKHSIVSLFEKADESLYQEFSDKEMCVYITFADSQKLLLPTGGNTYNLRGWEVHKLKDNSYALIKNDDVVRIQLENKDENNKTRSELKDEKLIRKLVTTMRKENEK